MGTTGRSPSFDPLPYQPSTFHGLVGEASTHNHAAEANSQDARSTVVVHRVRSAIECAAIDRAKKHGLDIRSTLATQHISQLASFVFTRATMMKLFCSPLHFEPRPRCKVVLLIGLHSRKRPSDHPNDPLCPVPGSIRISSMESRVDATIPKRWCIY